MLDEAYQLIHDSHLFDGMDSRQVAKAFALYDLPIPTETPSKGSH